ncbi:MAG: hypothetical protein AB7Q17_04560 [Phycisphaerae bacterium]
MQLTKFFRKNSRTLLMIFMALLLVVFLIGDTLQTLARGWANPNEKVATAFGRDVYLTDLNTADADIKLMQSLGLDALLPRAQGEPNPLDYHLLVTEAAAAGVRVGPQQVLNMLREGQYPPEMLERARAQSNRSLNNIYEVIGRSLATMEYAALQAAAGGESVPRQRLAFRNEKQNAVVKLAVIDARAWLDTLPEPDDAAVAALFEAGRDRRTAHTEEQLEFGYRYPDRVAVEYLTVAPQDLLPQVTVREREAQRYYEENKQKYVKQVPKPLLPPQTQPAQPEMETVQQSYAEVEEQVRSDVRGAKAIDEARRHVEKMYVEARRGWETAETDADGFRTPPPADKLVSFEALRDRFTATYPVRYGTTGLLDADALRRERDLAGMQFISGQIRKPISEMAFRVKGLMKPTREDVVPAMNLFEPSPILLAERFDFRSRRMVVNQGLFLRVTDVAPAGPPASIDEFRERVRADAKLAQAYEKAGEFARRLAERARQNGLDAAVIADEELRDILTAAAERTATQPADPTRIKPRFVEALGPITPPAFTRQPRPLQPPASLMNEKLHAEVFALADASAAGGGPADPHRVVLVPSAKDQKWIVAELVDVQPVYEGEFETQREALAQRAVQRERGAFQTAWFAPDNIRKRAGLLMVEDRQ